MLPFTSIVHFRWSLLCRALMVAFMVIGVLVPGGASTWASADSGADLAVQLGGTGTILLDGVRYTVTITNNGPEPLTSATVVVRLDARLWTYGRGAPCPVDLTAATMTCSFGGLPAGASAAMATTVYFLIGGNRSTLKATATRTASTPADLNGGNDSAATICDYQRPPEGPPTGWPSIFCAPA